MPLDDGELVVSDANFGIETSFTVGCDFDSVPSWGLPSPEFEGFGALFADSSLEGSS